MGFDAFLLIERRLKRCVGGVEDALDGTKRGRNALVEAAVRVGDVEHVAAAVLDEFVKLRLAHARRAGVLRLGHGRAASLHEHRARVAAVRMVSGASCVARLAHVAAHGAQSDNHLGNHLGAVATGHAVVVQQHGLVVLAHDARECGDLLRLNAADGVCPFGSLRRAVVGAQDVVFQVLVHLGVGRHALGVETDRVGMQEVPVDDIAFSLVEAKHLVGRGQQEGHVGAVANGQPVGVEHLGGSVVQRVDADELRAGLVSLDVVVRRGAGGRPRRVRSVHDDVFGILHVEAIVGVAKAAARQADHFRTKRVGAVRSGVPAAHAAAHHVDAGVGRFAIEARGAVFVRDALDFLAREVDRLVPANDFPLVFAAVLAIGIAAAAGLPALAFERVHNAVGAEALLLLGLAAHAATLLRIIGAVLMAVVGLLADDSAVFHHDLVHATAAAIVPASCVNPRSAFFRVHGLGLFGFLDLGIWGTAKRRKRSGAGGNRHAPLHKLAAADAGIGDTHLSPFIQLEPFPLKSSPSVENFRS